MYVLELLRPDDDVKRIAEHVRCLIKILLSITVVAAFVVVSVLGKILWFGTGIPFVGLFEGWLFMSMVVLLLFLLMVVVTNVDCLQLAQRCIWCEHFGNNHLRPPEPLRALKDSPRLFDLGNDISIYFFFKFFSLIKSII